MDLSECSWEDFSSYLFVDKKLATSKRSVSPLRSRYFIIQKNFSHIPFNRDNFTKFIQKLLSEGKKNSYVNGFIKMGKHIDKFLKINELQDYTYFREKQEFYDVLTLEEIKNIINASIPYERDADYVEERNRTFIRFVAMTGCRISEAIELEWKDVIHTPLPACIFRDTKNGEDRIVPLCGDLETYLSRLPKRSAKVFNMKDDTYITEDLKRRCKSAHVVKRVWWHLFRHSFVTTLLEQGVDDLIIGKIVGHKNPASTQRYNQMNISSLAVAMELHPIFQESQTLKTISDYLTTHIGKLLNKSKFSLFTQQKTDELTIRIKKAYT